MSYHYLTTIELVANITDGLQATRSPEPIANIDTLDTVSSKTIGFMQVLFQPLLQRTSSIKENEGKQRNVASQDEKTDA